MIHSLGLCSVVMHINSESVLFLRVSSVEDWRGPLNGPRVSPNWTEPAASATWSSLVSVVPTKNGTVLTLPPITACRNSAVSWYSTSKPLCCEWDSSPKNENSVIICTPSSCSIYIYAFSRRFYPKRLTLHSSYSFTFYQLLLSLGIEPMLLALLAPCSTIWATGKPQTCMSFFLLHVEQKTMVTKLDIHRISFHTMDVSGYRLLFGYTLKNAGLNTTQHWVKYGQTQWLSSFDPVVRLNVYPNLLGSNPGQMLGQNNPIVGFVHILPNAAGCI